MFVCDVYFHVYICVCVISVLKTVGVSLSLACGCLHVMYICMYIFVCVCMSVLKTVGVSLSLACACLYVMHMFLHVFQNVYTCVCLCACGRFWCSDCMYVDSPAIICKRAGTSVITSSCMQIVRKHNDNVYVVCT